MDSASGQAAFLEFFSAAAGTGIVAPDVSQGIADRHPEGIRDPLGRFLALRLRMESMPPGQFLNRIAERREIAIGVKRFGFGMVDGILQIFFEIPEF